MPELIDERRFVWDAEKTSEQIAAKEKMRQEAAAAAPAPARTVTPVSLSVGQIVLGVLGGNILSAVVLGLVYLMMTRM